MNLPQQKKTAQAIHLDGTFIQLQTRTISRLIAIAFLSNPIFPWNFKIRIYRNEKAQAFNLGLTLTSKATDSSDVRCIKHLTQGVFHGLFN